MRYVYTPHEDDIIRRLYVEQKVPCADIAVLLGRSAGSVQTRVVSLGMRRYSNKRFTTEEDEKIRAMFIADKPVEEIADETGRTISSVRKRVFDMRLRRDGRRVKLQKRYGIEIPPGQDAIAAIRQMREQTEQESARRDREHKERVARVLDEVETGVRAGLSRTFLFRAAMADGATLQAIGDRFGISRERVRQLVARAA